MARTKNTSGKSAPLSKPMKKKAYAPIANDNRLTIRCSVSQVRKIVKNISPSRAAILRSYGFGFVLNLQMRSIDQDYLRLVNVNFDGQFMSFQMPGGVCLYLTEDDVERVYGLPKGTNIVDFDIFDQRNTKEWALALGISTVDPNMIDLMQLKNDMRNTIDDESWVQMCILLSIGYVFDPNGSMTVMHKYLGFMRGRASEEIRNFNWCGHMLSRVRRAILGNSDRKYVEGDVHFLICAFLDRTGVPNTPGTVSTIIPSCTLWNEKRVSGRKEAVLSTSNDLRVVPILDFPGSKTNKNKLVEERFVRKTGAKHVDSMGIAREVCSKGVQPENSDGGESEQNMKPKLLFELMSLRTDHMDTNELCICGRRL